MITQLPGAVFSVGKRHNQSTDNSKISKSGVRLVLKYITEKIESRETSAVNMV